MKLVDKLSLWFIGITVLLTPVTAYICYYNLERKIDETEITRLKELNDMAAGRLGTGVWRDQQVNGTSTVVAPITTGLPEERMQISKTDTYNGENQGLLSLLT